MNISNVLKIELDWSIELIRGSLSNLVPFIELSNHQSSYKPPNQQSNQ